jgi:5-methylcytosine-specific restriction endonuclease McrBC regulatory subunit McrC
MTTKDNSSALIDAAENMDNLQWLSRSTIAELCNADYPGLLVFPDDISQSDDRIGNEHVFSITNGQLVTGNIMGFIGYKDTKVTIRSRFAQDDNDYFLHYMLQRVFSLNLFNLPAATDEEMIFDFLVFMFPHFLNKAMRQGLFKEYQTRHYNDSHLRGHINVGRHIRSNIPFMGKVAFDTREFSFDNSVTELIRHAIEYIRRLEYGCSILANSQETASNVNMIIHATPGYNRHGRQHVIDDNRRTSTHPYYQAYRDLQKLCLCILRHDELKYGHEEREIYGILFDGAWLWEEYLNTILLHVGFSHPRNKEKTGRITLFRDGSGWRYPDFYKDDFILDAKYKGYGNKQVSEIDRDDLHQVIAYMWITQAHHGGFLFPLQSGETVSSSKLLRGYDGELSLYGLDVSGASTDYLEFCSDMKEKEKSLIYTLQLN